MPQKWIGAPGAKSSHWGTFMSHSFKIGAYMIWADKKATSHKKTVLEDKSNMLIKKKQFFFAKALQMFLLDLVLSF